MNCQDSLQSLFLSFFLFKIVAASVCDHKLEKDVINPVLCNILGYFY